MAIELSIPRRTRARKGNPPHTKILRYPGTWDTRLDEYYRLPRRARAKRSMNNTTLPLESNQSFDLRIALPELGPSPWNA